MWYKESHHVKQCEKGDIYYRITKDEIIQVKIIEITHHNLGHHTYKDDLGNVYQGSAFGGSLFKTTEECKEELCRRQNIREKRKLLKEYETELNKKFNLGNHRVIK